MSPTESESPLSVVERARAMAANLHDAFAHAIRNDGELCEGKCQVMARAVEAVTDALERQQVTGAPCADDAAYIEAATDLVSIGDVLKRGRRHGLDDSNQNAALMRMLCRLAGDARDALEGVEKRLRRAGLAVA